MVLLFSKETNFSTSINVNTTHKNLFDFIDYNSNHSFKSERKNNYTEGKFTKEQVENTNIRKGNENCK
jgi:hypothetical protein